MYTYIYIIYIAINIYMYTLMKNPKGWAESIRDGFLRGITSTL